ncbi:hypothetical protein [Undibacter mobilis]|uniref:hypothetical protein n=1 Tax=Undibacter mobilis TaxID=2292256 RepID=UPI00143DA2D6|nr:hypothetical protein [Undibacter mobilis]
MTSATSATIGRRRYFIIGRLMFSTLVPVMTADRTNNKTMDFQVSSRKARPPITKA